MGPYDRKLKTVNRLINKYGENVTWRQVADAVPQNPNKPWVLTSQAPVDFPVKIAFFTASQQTLKTLMLDENANIAEGSIIGLMAGNVPFIPTLKDVGIREGKQLGVGSIQVLKPASIPILYTLVFKQ